jgi:hypothetical protein
MQETTWTRRVTFLVDLNGPIAFCDLPAMLHKIHCKFFHSAIELLLKTLTGNPSSEDRGLHKYILVKIIVKIKID